MCSAPQVDPSHALLSLFHNAHIQLTFICLWGEDVLFSLFRSGHPFRQWPYFMHFEHWLRARFDAAIYGDFVRFGVLRGIVVVPRFAFAFDFRLFARFFLRCFFYFRYDVSSEDEVSEVVEEDGDSERISIALLRWCSFSNLTFEFFATIIWSSTALQTSWSSHEPALERRNSIARRIYSSN